MTHHTADDAVSVLTDVAESVFEAESLYETSSITPENDDADDTRTETTETVTSSQAAKAIEAATEQEHTGGPVPDEDLEEDENSDNVVIQDAGPAPPDYAAATASRAIDSLPRNEEESAQPQQTVQHNIEAQSVVTAETNLKDPDLLIKEIISAVRPAIHAAWERVEPYYTKVVVFVQPAVRFTWEKVEPQYKKTVIVVGPVSRAIFVKIEPHYKKAVRFVEPYSKRAAEVINPVINTAGTRVERRLRKFAVANEPRLHKAWTHIEPASERTASAMRPILRTVVKLIDRFLRVLVNKHTIAFVHNHWLHILLANVTFTFALLFIITAAKPPRYIDVEVYPEFFSSHPRRGNPRQFHSNMYECPGLPHYSDFTHTRFESSETFTFQEHLDLSTVPELSNISYTGTIDVRPGPPGQRSPIEVWFNTASSWNTFSDAPRFQRYRNAISLQMPEVSENYYYDRRPRPSGMNERRCIDIWVGIYIKIEMESLNISTNHFSVNIDEVEESSSWSLTAKEKIQISAQDGNIENNVNVNAKEIVVTTTEGRINGLYRLRDRLQLEGGELDVLVEQQPRGRDIPEEALEHVTPSVLRTASTKGGTLLDLYEATSATPPAFVFDNTTGHWTAEDPAEDDDDTPYWALNSYSWNDYYLLDALHTSSDSGRLSLGYRAAIRAWAGTIDGTVINGTVKFSSDVLYEDDQKPNVTRLPDGEHFHAVVRESNSTVRFNSSDADVVIALDRFW